MARSLLVVVVAAVAVAAVAVMTALDIRDHGARTDPGSPLGGHEVPVP